MPYTAEINTKGHLSIGGCDTCDLAQQFGTPLYVLDEETIRTNCQNYISAFEKHLPQTKIIFASKSLSTLATLELIKAEGLEIDVVSSGELFFAKKAGFPGDKIWFHGNNKSESEIIEALDYNVNIFVVDNVYELELLDRLAKKANKKVDVLFRVIPGIEAHTHEYIQTGQLDSKFGISPDQIIQVLKYSLEKKNINFKGLHVHIGSQILEIKPYSVLIEILFDLIKEIKNKLKIEPEILNLGGGLGINYLNKDNAPYPEDLASTIQSTAQFKARENRINIPQLAIEPGRSIVGNAGITLYTIGASKEIKGLRKFFFIDGGMADNIRPALYNAEYDAVIANKVGEKKKELVTIAGKFCESGDILIKDIQIQPPEDKDILAVFGTGAYNYSMASNYNQALKPAMVLVKNKQAKLIVKRQTCDDLIRDHLPLE
ncbi:MAG: diaminopimelate decarboxylase [Candidatus Margulisbacteria bacterium]|nr:diaminopimelate decarboxylase [Candidatus Margulisiibacteriota bacterium]